MLRIVKAMQIEKPVMYFGLSFAIKIVSACNVLQCEMLELTEKGKDCDDAT